MPSKKIKKPTKKRLAILLKRKQTRKTVEGVDFFYKPSGTKSATQEVLIKHFDSSRHGCNCEVLEDGRIYTSSKPADKPASGQRKPS